MDPIYTCIKIALLALYPDNTKISVYNNRIDFREPSLYQGIMRWSFGEKRSDILNLKQSLINIKYIFRNKNIKSGDVILKYMSSGINKLKFCYIRDKIIKENLESIEDEYVAFYNNNGTIKDNEIVDPDIIVDDYMDKWIYPEIEFINHNFKCIELLKTTEETEYKNNLVKTYISIINNFINNKIE